MSTLIPTILKLDVSGLPIEWITWQTAATLYARDRVKWEAGDTRFTVYGGSRRDGTQSSITMASIIAVQDKSRRFERRRPPALTNRGAVCSRWAYLPVVRRKVPCV